MIRWSVALSLVSLLGPATLYAHPKPTPAPAARKAVHVVLPGETLGLLAKRYGASVKALTAANGLTRPDFLRPGQTLVIPRAGAALAKPNGTERTPAGSAQLAHFVLTPPDFDGRAPEFRWPVEGAVSSPFGRRRNGWHTGIDIQAEVGTPIFAAAPGTVYYSGWEKRYGLVVKLEHADGFVSVYAHNLQVFVEAGEEVSQGQIIGTVGRTGRASSFHLHFEVRNNGRVYNPLHLLPVREAGEPELVGQPEDDDEDDE